MAYLEQIGARIQTANHTLMDEETVDYLLSEAGGLSLAEQEEKYKRITGLMRQRLKILFEAASGERIIIGTEAEIAEEGKTTKTLDQVLASIQKINSQGQYEMDFIYSRCFNSPTEAKEFLEREAAEVAGYSPQPEKRAGIVGSVCQAVVRNLIIVSEEGITQRQRDFVGCTHNLANLWGDFMPGFSPARLKLPGETDPAVINRAFMLLFSPEVGAWEVKNPAGGKA